MPAPEQPIGYEKLTSAKVYRPAEWMKYLRFSLGAKTVYAFDTKYANWNCKKGIAGKDKAHFLDSLRQRVVECRNKIDAPSLYDRW